MISKKGVSPLIATILLVGFTIAIGAMVSSFLIKNAQENFKPEVIIKDSEFCDSVALGYVYNSSAYGSNWHTKSDTKFLYGFNITNKGSYSIRNLTIRSFGVGEFKTGIIDYKSSTTNSIKYITDGIKPGQNAEVRFSYNSQITGDAAIVEFTPWIKDFTVTDKDVYIVCSARSLKVNLCEVYKTTTGNSDCKDY